MLPEVRLVNINKDDVGRIAQWLQDEEVSASWYGTNQNGDALHIGYSPKQMLDAGPDDWARTFNQKDRKVFSVITELGRSAQHIGEGQLLIEAPPGEAQLFILIGRKDLWYQGYGTAALVHLLDRAFYGYGLHRVWVDIPEYNRPAIHMCERVGFMLEGRLRGTHPKDDKWYDSFAMGLLSQEYARRRAQLLGTTKLPEITVESTYAPYMHREDAFNTSEEETRWR
jgi:RimJ/RimL family protein N-acetyltransferase